ALSTAVLLQHLAEDRGMDSFVTWIGALATSQMWHGNKSKHQKRNMVSRDTVRFMFGLLDVESVTGASFPTFFDVLVQSGEQLGLGQPEQERERGRGKREREQDMVPVIALQQLGRAFGNGMLRLSSQISQLEGVDVEYPVKYTEDDEFVSKARAKGIERMKSEDQD
ncbi:hypothetical protein KIPB_005052, partial [Kipferlia bialata]